MIPYHAKVKNSAKAEWFVASILQCSQRALLNLRCSNKFTNLFDSTFLLWVSSASTKPSKRHYCKLGVCRVSTCLSGLSAHFQSSINHTWMYSAAWLAPGLNSDPLFVGPIEVYIVYDGQESTTGITYRDCHWLKQTRHKLGGCCQWP